MIESHGFSARKIWISSISWRVLTIPFQHRLILLKMRTAYIYIYMEVPGIDIHKVSVFYKDGEITIKGSKESKPLAENEKAIRIERYYGNFERTFSIKYPVNEHSIKASLTDGILTVTMDKISEKKNIDIQT